MAGTDKSEFSLDELLVINLLSVLSCISSLYIHTHIYIYHVERKVPKYENHKLRERKVKTLTRN